MTALLASAGAVLVTWLLRVLFITLVPAGHLPAVVQRALPHVGPAVLAAVVAAALLGGRGGADVGSLAGAAAVCLVAWRSGSILLATAAGLGVVTLVHLLG